MERRVALTVFEPPLCPSGRPDMAGAVAFGVVQGSVTEPRVGYLDRAVPTSAELLAAAGPVTPGEVFRFAGPCAGGGCLHFDGSDCQLVRRVAALLPPAVDRLPACVIRPACRWWQQEGREACVRCPQVVTENYQPSEAMRHAADPRGGA